MLCSIISSEDLLLLGGYNRPPLLLLHKGREIQSNSSLWGGEEERDIYPYNPFEFHKKKRRRILYFPFEPCSYNAISRIMKVQSTSYPKTNQWTSFFSLLMRHFLFLAYESITILPEIGGRNRRGRWNFLRDYRMPISTVES